MAMDQNPTRNRPVELAIIFIFIVALFVPLLSWTLQKDALYSEAEKRELQQFPSITTQGSVVGFTRSFDSYFQDHFGLREWLIHQYHRELKKRFGKSSGLPVLEGTDNWLFFTGFGDKVLEDLQGKLRFSEGEEQRFRHLLAEKKAWLGKQGVAYVFMVAPNKQSIYPEYMPQHYQQFQKTSRLDHLLTGSHNNDNEKLLDVRPYLRQKKSEARLYDKSDTHWNSQGAFFVYQVLMERIQTLFADFQPRENFHFLPDWQAGIGGDLAEMSGIKQSTVEQRPVLDRSDFSALEKPISEELAGLLSLPQFKPFYTENKNGRLRVLVLHDSFFNKITGFTSESFQQAFYVWQYYDKSTMEFLNRENLSTLLELYQPDLVIEETVERFLPHFFIANGWLE